MATPLEPLPRLGRELGVDLRVKRDDLFPFTGGGTKARKAVRIVAEVERARCDAVVTTGGLQSNHARVMALAAAVRGWRCTLVLHGDPAEAIEPRGNLLLARLAGAQVVVVEPSAIAAQMRLAMEQLRAEGHRPYEVPGGGHSCAGALALVDATCELAEQCRQLDWQPDWLLHASGTGTTQAGLVVGLERLGWPTRVVGISVARRNPRGLEVVEQACADLRQRLGLAGPFVPVDFRDGWVGDGYEAASPPVLATIGMAARAEGLVLDPTYTGKAFTALADMVRSNEIHSGAKVLFWHTGGLVNLLASGYSSQEIGNP